MELPRTAVVNILGRLHPTPLCELTSTGKDITVTNDVEGSHVSVKFRDDMELECVITLVILPHGVCVLHR